MAAPISGTRGASGDGRALGPRPGRHRWPAVIVVALLLVASGVGCGSSSGEEGGGVTGVRAIRYGPEPSQIGELTVPRGPGPHPVVVLIHGGWWRASDFDRRAMRDLAEELVDDGFATWNIEYRLLGEPGAGWPGTFEDVAAGIDELAEIARYDDLDLERVAVLGHSAGGQLALWAGARPTFAPGTPGAGPVVTPAAVVAVAPVADLAGTAEEGLGDGAVSELLGGLPDEVPERYQATSPVALIPSGTRTLVVHGTEDMIVPVQQSRDFSFASAQAGDITDYLELDGADHFAAIDPESSAWDEIQIRLAQLLAPQ